MAAKDPSCNPPKDTCACPVWDENALVQRCAELPAIIAAPDPISLVSTATVGLAGAAQEITFTVPVNMLWTGSTANRTGAFREAIRLDWEEQSINNGPSPIVRDVLFWGQPGQPSRHPPKFIPRNKTMTITIEDISGIGAGIINTVWLALHGFQIPPELINVYREAFGPGKGLMRYATTRLGYTIAAGTQGAPPPIQIEQGAHFRHDTTCMDSTSPLLEGKYSYRDVRSLRRVDNCNRRILSSLWTGCIKGNSPATGLPGAPYVVPSPELMQAGSTIELDLQDDSNAPNTCFFLFTGAREKSCNPDGIASTPCAS